METGLVPTSIFRPQPSYLLLHGYLKSFNRRYLRYNWAFWSRGVLTAQTPRDQKGGPLGRWTFGILLWVPGWYSDPTYRKGSKIALNQRMSSILPTPSSPRRKLELLIIAMLATDNTRKTDRDVFSASVVLVIKFLLSLGFHRVYWSWHSCLHHAESPSKGREN